MPSNIHIGIQGSANLGPARAELVKLQSEFATLNARMIAAAQSGESMSNIGAGLRQLGTDFSNNAAQTLKWQTVQKRVKDQTVQYTEDLIKHKNALASVNAARKSGLSQMAYQEQLRLRSAQVSTLGRTPNGDHLAQMMIPATAEKGLNTLANRAGFAASELKSASTQMVNFGKNTQWAGRQLTVGFSVPLMAAGAATGYMAAQADAALTRIAKVYDTVNRDNLSSLDQAIAKETELKQLRVDGMATAKTAAQQYGASMQDTLAAQGDIAATGINGRKLQESTNETMRLATLGEMDYQTAVQATITLQSVFRQSSEELTNTFNLMNAVENQTSLSMQDFATAIPIAAAPIKALNGDMNDLALLMVSMKARGIDAAEGANAIKSAFNRLQSPGKAVQALFTELTGKDINKLVDETGGELIPTLQALGETVSGLDDLSKSRVLGKLFGTYQNTRITAMLTGITEDFNDANSQVGRALELTQSSQEKLAGLADDEIKRMQESASGRLKIAVQTIKVQLAELGTGFLEAAVKIIESGQDLLEFFSNLPDGLKSFLKVAAITIALIGPIGMLIGLAANMGGTILKAGASVVMLATRFKLLDRNTVLATHAAKASESVMKKQQVQTENLTIAISALGDAYAKAAAKQDLMNGPTRGAGRAEASSRYKELTSGENKAKLGRDNRYYQNGKQLPKADQRLIRNARDMVPSQRTSGGLAAGTKTMDQLHSEANRINNGKNLQIANAASREAYQLAQKTAAEEARRSRAINTSAMGAGLFTAAMVASLVPLGEGSEKSSEIKSNIVNWGMATGAALPLLANAKGAFIAIAGATSAMATTTKTKLAAGMTSMATGWKASAAGATGLASKMKLAGRTALSLGGLINPWAAGLAAAAGGAFLLYKHLKKAGDEAKKINEDVDGLGKIFGFTPTDQVDPATLDKDSINTQRQYLIAFNKEYPTFATNIKAAGSDLEKFTMATQQGFKAFDGGATAEEAKQVTKTALMAAGKTAKEADAIIIKFDFDPNAVDQRMRVVNQKLQESMDKSEGVSFNPFKDKGGSDAKASGAQAAAAVASLINTGDLQAAAATQDEVISKLNKQIKGKSFADGSEVAKNFIKGYAEKFGADKETIKEIQNSFFGDIDIETASSKGVKGIIDSIDFNEFSPDLNAYVKQQEQLAQFAKVEAGYKKDVLITGDGLLQQAMGHRLNAEQTTLRQQQALAAAKEAYNTGKGEADLDQITLGILRQIEAATGVRLLGENGVLAVLAAQNKELDKQKTNYGSEAAIKHSKKLTDAVKSDLASLDEVYKRRADGLEASHKAKMDGIEEGQRKREAAFDRQQTAMDNRQDKEQRRFDKKWDKRIDKLKSEEDLRKSIFEAERNRIKRLADMQANNINFNAALQGGDLDEAARIQLSSNAQTQTNQLDDLDNKLGAKADKKLDTLQSQKEDAKYKLKKHQDFEKQAFAATKKRYSDQVAAAKKAAQDSYSAMKAGLENEKTVRKANLEGALAQLSKLSYSTKEKWLSDLKDIRTNFGIYGGSSGKLFGEKAAKQMFEETVAGLKKIAEDKAAEEAGASSTKNFIVGAGRVIGLSKKELKQFAKNHWSTGQGGGQVRHGGGPLNKQSNNRKGYAANAATYPSEVNVLAKKSEYMMQTSAHRKYGTEALDAVNKGQAEIVRHSGGAIGGPAKGVADAGYLRQTALVNSLAMARVKQYKKSLDNAKTDLTTGAVVGSGGNMKGVDPNGWNKPWKGTYGNGGVGKHDWGLPANTPLYAPHSGTVKANAIPGVETRRSHGGYGFKSFGQYIDFTGGGAQIRMAHLNKLPIAAGKSMKVKAGQFMGLSGETGNTMGAHVHMERIPPGGNNSNAGGFFASRGVSLAKGTERVKYDNVAANLHKGEMVLTEDISNKFRKGVDNFANGSNTEYNVNITVAGNATNDTAEKIADVVIKKLKAKESRKGTGR